MGYISDEEAKRIIRLLVTALNYNPVTPVEDVELPEPDVDEDE